ncbi:TPA: hypothetical protein HA318_02615 [Candidatus Micrarchaeota archaeon]|nr:MAG: hypothetical protein AUJ65_06250 [Candidatus Micrarchaeota archaeon CG1_02_51_15]HII38870.1 hypothetical protein [Candidatus Micrarchaeota archaeon]
MKLFASAPTKLIICGEHAVVYGGRAVAVPLSIRNAVELTELEGAPRFAFDAGQFSFEYDANGVFSGHPLLKGAAAMLQHIFRQCNKTLDETGALKATRHLGGAPKGTGNSASIAAALASATYTWLGRTLSRDELFDAVQIEENGVVGGSASGIDARTVIAGKPQGFRKEWDSNGNTKFFFNDLDLRLPEGTALIVIDSKRGDEKPMTTGELVAFFARNKFEKLPSEVTPEERKAVCNEFDPVVIRVESQLRQEGDAEQLGQALSENHGLLRKYGVSSEGIEAAIATALEAGALGAKLTGAGGPAGAALALVENEVKENVEEALGGKGFKAIPAQFDFQGITVEEFSE